MVSVGVSLFKAKSAVPMASIIIVSSAMALCLVLIGRQFIKTKVVAKQGGGVAAH
jgi:DHA1 family bicyclomycin/chloramphenicol resistance-like MFS transporter